MQLSWKHPLTVLPVLLLLAVYAGAAFGVAGNVQFVAGDVRLVTRDGVARALQKGEAVNEGDRIVTAAGAAAQIKMIDGGLIAIRPDTDLSLDTYRYAGSEDGTESAIVSLLRGGFRTITGIIGRRNKDNYLIRTETATIGIRGTDHEPMVILVPAAGQVAIAPPGTYDKVNVGVAYIRNDAGSIDIQRNQVGFAPVTKTNPVILPTIPPFYKPTPAPEPQKAKDESKKEGGQGEAAPIRSTAAVDPAAASTAAPAAAPVATAPVVAITATDASGVNLNATRLTTSASGITTPIGSTPIAPPAPVTPPAPPPPIVSNPPVAASNYGFGVMAAVPVTGGVDLISFGSPAASSNVANSNFVLSDKNLVEIVQSPYARFGLAATQQSVIANADIKFSGGTAADAASDPNGTYYLGRWSGGQIGVTDRAATSPVAPFADALGTSSAHWLIGLTPGNVAGTSINNVQALVGKASYSLAAATHPTDGFGNVGTLNSATLNADFTAQTVDSNLNLSFSSTDPVNLSKRNLNLTAAATQMPIDNIGFGGAVIAPVVAGQPTSVSGINNTVSCSGADCAAGGYVGTIGGAFLAAATGGSSSGAVGTGVGLNYGFIAIPTAASTALQPFADFITGAAVLSTSTAPIAGSVAVPVSGGTGTYRHLAFGAQTIGATTYYAGFSTASGTTLPAQNYSYDASGNLVRMQSSNYGLSERGTSGLPSYTVGANAPYTGTPGGLPTSPLSGAAVVFAGGATPDGNYNDSVNGIRMGRYAGGTITTTDSSAPASPVTYVTPLGSNSLNWAVRELPASIPTTGSFEYASAYATKPSDSLGNVGTLNYASLSADFTRQTVNPAVSITINDQNLAAAATGVPIAANFGFDVSSRAAQNASGGALQVICSGGNCAPAAPSAAPSTRPYGGRITGALAGSGTAGGAFFRYDFNTRYDPANASDVAAAAGRPINDYIQGLVAFTKGPGVAAQALPTASAGAQIIATSYWQLQQPAGAGSSAYYQPWTQDYFPSSTGYTSAFGSGSPNTVTDFDPGNPTPHAETLTGGTVAQVPTNANSAAATGISFGRYTGGTLTGNDWQGKAFSFANPGNYAWIKGPSTGFVAGAMSGTAKYVYDGGTAPSTVQDTTGAVNNAVLAVDFNRSAVGVDLSVSIPSTSTTWTATSTPGGVLTGTPLANIRLSENEFNASSFWTTNPALQKSLYVTRTIGTATSAVNSGVEGIISGSLMGAELSGAGMTYSFRDFTTPPGVANVNGAVAFALDSYTSNANVTTTGTSAIDPSNVAYLIGLGATGLIADPTATNAPASVDSEYLTRIHGQIASVNRTAVGANGLPTIWDGEIPVTVPPSAGCTINCSTNIHNVAARFSIDAAQFAPTGTTPVSGQVALPASKSIASVLEAGLDPATGMRWGRYGGGVVAIFDRIGGGFAPKTADLGAQNWHFILSPTQAGPTMLPTTGTYSYAKAGGTSPTDNLGSAAGVLNAATLVADFAAQTVNAGVNLTVNGQTWAAGANAIPIQERLYFGARRDPSGGGNLNVCVGSSCGTTTLPSVSSADTAGRLVGAFSGTSGQGMGMAYSLNQGGATGTTVSGVVAFKR